MRSRCHACEHGNGWLKPTGNPWQVRCWCGSANPTLYPYPRYPHGKTCGFTHTRAPPYLWWMCSTLGHLLRMTESDLIRVQHVESKMVSPQYWWKKYYWSEHDMSFKYTHRVQVQLASTWTTSLSGPISALSCQWATVFMNNMSYANGNVLHIGELRQWPCLHWNQWSCQFLTCQLCCYLMSQTLVLEM